MAHQEFLRDGSEQALTNWVNKQLDGLPGVTKIDRLEWLQNQKQTHFYQLIESLKGWHLRLLKTAVKELSYKLMTFSQEDQLSDHQKRVYFAGITSVKEYQSFETFNYVYGSFIEIINQLEKENA